MHRLRPQRLHQCALAIDRRENLFRDDLFRLRRAFGRQAGLAQLLDEGGDQHRLRRRLVAQRRLHLHRRVQDIVGREHAPGGVGLLPLQLAVHGRGEGFEPRQIGVGVRRILHAMLRIEEVGDFAIAAGQLGQNIGRVAAHRLAIAELLATQRPVELIGDDVIVELARFAERRAVDAGEPARLRLHPRDIFGDACGAGVAQLPAQRRSRPGVEAEPGRAFRRGFQPLVEKLVQHHPELGIGGRGLGKEARSRGGDRSGAAGGKKLASVHGWTAP